MNGDKPAEKAPEAQVAMPAKEKITADSHRVQRLRECAQDIINRFEELNGSECSMGCGVCIKCLLEQALSDAE